MEILTQIVNFFLGLGASVFVPFIMIIAGLIVRKLKMRFHLVLRWP